MSTLSRSQNQQEALLLSNQGHLIASAEDLNSPTILLHQQLLGQSPYLNQQQTLILSSDGTGGGEPVGIDLGRSAETGSSPGDNVIKSNTLANSEDVKILKQHHKEALKIEQRMKQDAALFHHPNQPSTQSDLIHSQTPVVSAAHALQTAAAVANAMVSSKIKNSYKEQSQAQPPPAMGSSSGRSSKPASAQPRHMGRTQKLKTKSSQHDFIVLKQKNLWSNSNLNFGHQFNTTNGLYGSTIFSNAHFKQQQRQVANSSTNQKSQKGMPRLSSKQAKGQWYYSNSDCRSTGGVKLMQARLDISNYYKTQEMEQQRFVPTYKFPQRKTLKSQANLGCVLLGREGENLDCQGVNFTRGSSNFARPQTGTQTAPRLSSKGCQAQGRTSTLSDQRQEKKKLEKELKPSPRQIGSRAVRGVPLVEMNVRKRRPTGKSSHLNQEAKEAKEILEARVSQSYVADDINAIRYGIGFKKAVKKKFKPPVLRTEKLANEARVRSGDRTRVSQEDLQELRIIQQSKKLVKEFQRNNTKLENMINPKSNSRWDRSWANSRGETRWGSRWGSGVDPKLEEGNYGPGELLQRPTSHDLGSAPESRMGPTMKGNPSMNNKVPQSPISGAFESSNLHFSTTAGADYGPKIVRAAEGARIGNFSGAAVQQNIHAATLGAPYPCFSEYDSMQGLVKPPMAPQRNNGFMRTALYNNNQPSSYFNNIMTSETLSNKNTFENCALSLGSGDRDMDNQQTGPMQGLHLQGIPIGTRERPKTGKAVGAYGQLF